MLGKSAWGTTQVGWMYESSARVHGDQEMGKIECVFHIMRWCLLTLGFPKCILPIAQSVSVIAVCSYFPASFPLANWRAVRDVFFGHNGIQVHLKGLSIGVSRCSSNYTRVPSAARLTLCICIDRLTYYMQCYDVANLLTVTKTNMIDEMPCGYGTVSTTAVRMRHQISHRAA